MCRMAGIDSHRFHVGHHGCEHYVPALGRVFIDAHLHALEAVDHCGECEERFLEAGGYFATLVGRAVQTESYDMF